VARAQLLREAAVAATPTPVIATSVLDNGTVTLSINYADAATGDTSVLSFSL
jgi:hypothetical protein